MAGLNIGTLLGYLRLDGGPQFLAGTRAAQESLDLTGASAKRAGASIDQTSAAMVGAGRQADVAAAGSAKLRAAQLSLVAAQERYNLLVGQSDVSTGRLAASQASLVRAQERVRATTPVTPESIGMVDQMGGKIRSLVTDTAKMAVGFAAIGAIFELGSAVKSANDFQRQMLLIQTQAGASADEVHRMTSEVLKLSPEVATSPEQLATSLYHIESVGLRGAQALDVLRIAAEGAKVGNADLEQTTNALTSTVASGIPGVENMSQAMGVLNAIVGSGDMKLSDLNEALGGGILAVVKGYGLSLRDVGAALATFGDNNIRGADAATMLRMAVQSMSQPAKEGQKELDLLGLKVDTLRKDMQTGGLDKAILDLNAHLKASGVQADQVGGIITEVFGKKAGPGLAVLMGQIDRLQTKYADLDKGAQTFGSAWDETTKTASFGFDKLKASAESVSVEIFQKVGPVLGQVASDVGIVLPAALSVLGHALTPVGAVLGVFGGLLKNSGDAAKGVADALHTIEPVAGRVGAVLVGMWLGFKAGEAAVATVTAVQKAITALPAVVDNAGTRIKTFWASTGLAAEGAAVKTSASAAAIEAEAAAMSGSVVASGEAAAVGWAGLAGPLVAAAVGVGVLIAMFHKSAGASKEATDAAKTYTDALSNPGADLSSTIIGQLSNNNVPQKIDALNKSLGSAAYAGSQFLDAVQHGGPALDSLRARLQATIDTNDKFVVAQKNAQQALGQETTFGGKTVGPKFDQAAMDKAAAASDNARKLLADLTDQYDALNAAQLKDLQDTAAFAGVSSSIDKVAASTEVGSKTAQEYAQMLGIFVDKNGIAAVSADDLAKAIDTVTDAENNATQTGTEFLSALSQFSGSAGTAADRAALIGATLKAANGDALSYAGAMTGAAAANRALTDAFSNDDTTIAGLKDQLVQLTTSSGGASQSNGLLAAQINKTTTTAANNAQTITELQNKLKDHNLTAAQAAAAQKSLATAQANAGVYAAQLTDQQTKLKDSLDKSGGSADQVAQVQQKLADAYANSEKASIDLNTGTIDYTKKGAPALVQQLQAIQDAADKAAQATYQHELRTKGAKDAADDAYQVYVNQTRGQLVDEAKKLGLTEDQAKKLADQYFGLANADDIKKTIEMEGSDTVTNILKGIGEQLSFLTGHPWTIGVAIGPDPGTATQADRAFLSDPLLTDTHPHAKGGYLNPGWNVVGEEGPELIGPDRKVYPTNSPQTKAYTGSGAAMAETVNINLIQPVQSEPVERSIPRALRAAALSLGF